jgi:polyisoprenoid-binding protein YceI
MRGVRAGATGGGRASGTRRGPRAPLALAALLLLPAPAAGQALQAYRVDGARSHLRFYAVSRFVNVQGAFARLGGEVTLDPARPEGAAGRLVVDVASLDTGIRMRDDHLRGPDFLDAGRFPEAAFVVTGARARGPEWLVEGRLALRGVVRALGVPITLDVGPGGLRVAGEVTLSRREFGISYDSVINPIRDQVRVTFDLLAVPA